MVSDITSNSFSLSWTGNDEAFESFVVELIDSDRFSEPLEYTVPGTVRSTDFNNLISGTNYVIYLYGVANGRRTNPVTTVALTGISALSQHHFIVSHLTASSISAH